MCRLLAVSYLTSQAAHLCSPVLTAKKTTVSIITKFCRVIETPKYSLLMVQISPKQIQDGGWLHLENSKNCNISVTERPTLTKFRTVMCLGPQITSGSAIAEGPHDVLLSRNLQLQNIAIVWHYLRDPTFSRFDTIPECDRHTDTHTDRNTTTAYTALSIASRGKNASHVLPARWY